MRGGTEKETKTETRKRGTRWKRKQKKRLRKTTDEQGETER
uniref:Uncharacterized protein n=1 Tax=Anguilla anguilla TaxID=7936 RepID=A0A0E9U2L1_ANGAN